MKKLTLLSLLSLVVGCGGILASCDPSTTTEGSDPSLGSGGGAGADVEEDYGEDFAYSGKVRIYYHNDQNDYGNKRLWVWGVNVDGNSLGEVSFDNQTSPDDYGVYVDIDLSVAPWNVAMHSSISFIVKESMTWRGQSTDTICPFNKFRNYLEKDDNGNDLMIIYAVDNNDGTISTYNTRAKALGDRIGSAYFSSWREIRVVGTGTQDGRGADEIGKVANYSLYAFDNAYYQMDMSEQSSAKSSYLVESGSPDSNDFTITLPEDALPYIGYTVEATFASDQSQVKSKAVSFVSLYDDPKFESQYTYDRADLGMTYDEDGKPIFRLWAPTAYRVQVNRYVFGTTSALSFTGNEPLLNSHKSFDMTLKEHGVWEITYPEIRSQNGIFESDNYYTYSVTNSEGTVETSDPYGISTGINGERSLYVSPSDYEKLTPEGFDEAIDSLPEISAMNELFVYETHIRDVTADETWISNEGNPRGTYLAFAEHGTTYTENGVTVTTGLDSILELGINAIQLLPVFDQDNDERPNEETGFNGDYNWGYNPKNYNSPEGAYSTDPYSGLTKIGEFKTLIKTLADSGVRTIMDVVYNHTASISGSSFTKTMPRYYYRTAADGTYIDGTGVGNVIASERPMARKFIVDSVVHWASEYGIKGFRFDLMGCLDIETMKAVRLALDEIDPTIAVYGEGWDGSFGGDLGLDRDLAATTGACYSQMYAGAPGMDSKWGIGAFNDGGRDGLKGNTQWGSSAPAYGFVSQGSEHLSADTRSHAVDNTMGINHNGGGNPSQTVNYASCHDNYTLYDQMNYCVGNGTTSSEDSQEARDATIAVTAAVAYSEGLAFIHGGEEIFRQKVMYDTDEYWDVIDDTETSRNDYVDLDDGTRLIRNSYTYGDAVNSYKYDRKIEFLDDCVRYQNACKSRLEGMENGYLGRQYDGNIWRAEGTEAWGDYNDYDGARKTVFGCNLFGLDGKADRYVAMAGRDPSDAMRQLSIGSGSLKVVYSSSGREVGSTISVGTYLQLSRFEFLVVERS